MHNRTLDPDPRPILSHLYPQSIGMRYKPRQSLSFSSSPIISNGSLAPIPSPSSPRYYPFSEYCARSLELCEQLHNGSLGAHQELNTLHVFVRAHRATMRSSSVHLPCSPNDKRDARHACLFAVANTIVDVGIGVWPTTLDRKTPLASILAQVQS